MTLNDFLSEFVLADVPGCPTAVAKKALLQKATEFLTHTQVWNEVQDATPVAESAQEYDLEAPPGALCIDIKAIYSRCGKLTGVNLDRLAEVLPDWQTAEGSTPAWYTRAFDFTTFHVYPKPVHPGVETMTVHAVYTLKRTATVIADVIVDRYGDDIAHGVKAHLMVMPKVTWQDLQLAGFHKGEFEQAMSMAKITAAHGKTAGAVRARPRRFGQ